jgi:hypothetical protein
MEPRLRALEAKERIMKALTLLFATLALLLSTMAHAQSNPQQSGSQDNSAQQQKPQDNQSMQSGQSTQTNSGPSQKMQGKVSKSGKAVTNDKDNKSYKVSNPSALKDYEGQDVGLIVAVDPDSNTIHIISVAPPQP